MTHTNGTVPKMAIARPQFFSQVDGGREDDASRNARREVWPKATMNHPKVDRRVTVKAGCRWTQKVQSLRDATGYSATFPQSCITLRNES
jgi:hypothetical protein